VCTDQGTGPGAPAAAPTLHDLEPVIEIDLEPVDSVVVTAVMDNSRDRRIIQAQDDGHGPEPHPEPRAGLVRRVLGDAGPPHLHVLG
jgi:hypothetical protein